LGAWGALIPFVGPLFNFAYTLNQAWTWTASRGWLEVLPGVVTVVGGLLLIGSRNRASAMLGGWLASFAGAWFVVGTAFAPLFQIGAVGDPVAATDRKRAALEVAYFSGLGTLIVFLGGAVLARLAVRLARDVQPVQAVEPAPEPYLPAEDMSSSEPPSEALTRPRDQRFAPSHTEPRPSGGGLFRRHRAGAPVGHPQ
jgi:hypothetical protein